MALNYLTNNARFLSQVIPGIDSTKLNGPNPNSEKHEHVFGVYTGEWTKGDEPEETNTYRGEDLFMRFEMRQGDGRSTEFSRDVQRVELSTSGPDNPSIDDKDEVRFSAYMYLESNNPVVYGGPWATNGGAKMVLAQVLATDPGFTPIVQLQDLRTSDSDGSLVLDNKNVRPPSGEKKIVPVLDAELTEGRWHHLVWDIKLSRASDGYYKFYLDGDLMVDWSGIATATTGQKSSAYLKLGPYLNFIDERFGWDPDHRGSESSSSPIVKEVPPYVVWYTGVKEEPVPDRAPPRPTPDQPRGQDGDDDGGGGRAPRTVRIEAEDFTGLDDARIFVAEPGGPGSGRSNIFLVSANSRADTVETELDVTPGTYTLAAGYFLETDGTSRMRIDIDGQSIASWSFNQGTEVNPSGPTGRMRESGNLREIDFESDPFTVTEDSVLTVRGIPDGGRARLDYVELVPVTRGSAQQMAQPVASGDEDAVLDLDGFRGSAAALNLNGDARIVSDSLRLTPDASSQAGSAWYDRALAVDSDTSFSTTFTFRNERNNNDGFTFVLQDSRDGANALGGQGGGLGLGGKSAIDRSVAVSFDTFKNGYDRSDNQLALIVDGRVDRPEAAVDLGGFDLNGGGRGKARIDYDGDSNLLEVFVAGGSSALPDTPQLWANINLPAEVGDEALVGFTAATGAIHGAHDIQSWTFIADDPFI